jgi:hypothetical protein
MNWQKLPWWGPSFEEKSRLTFVLYVWVVASMFPTYVEGMFCTRVYTRPALCAGYVYTPSGVKVGCRRVKTRVKTTDMCLSGQRVADMLADMLAT